MCNNNITYVYVVREPAIFSSGDYYRSLFFTPFVTGSFLLIKLQGARRRGLNGSYPVFCWALQIAYFAHCGTRLYKRNSRTESRVGLLKTWTPTNLRVLCTTQRNLPTKNPETFIKAICISPFAVLYQVLTFCLPMYVSARTLKLRFVLNAFR